MPHADPEVARAYHREYRQRTKAQRAARRPLDDSARHANRRAKLYNAPGHLTYHDIVAVLPPDAVCHYCGGTTLLGIDHKIPMHAGGPNTRANLVACCRSCNAKKWRGSWPPRWARDYDACVECGTTEKRHSTFGRCTSCDSRIRTRERRALIREREREGVAAAGP